ncbi:Gpr1 family protein [Histoplasma capsulatum var. duboisii H88]|uniref:GPR1/FUN34/yaaH n=1 Tax=Ajellomyces capsulatus (strain H88) TaxID=544711 RepID=F0US40_AJEC8|nr:Gpr1 family protein [Histoplasma capsulatum var. duboisii H88]QSS50723.1 GPR1/FUN34/yaaH [Histoplasma capsulatum var. duboisii H88]
MSDKQRRSSAEGISFKEHWTGSAVHIPNHLYPKLGNPVPLVLFGFATTAFVTALYQCGAGLPDSNPLGDVGGSEAAFGLAVFFGGMAQVIAGIMAFTTGNTFGTTAHIAYGCFWLSFAMFMVPSLGIKNAYVGNQRAYSFAMGIYLLFWCVLSIMLLVASLRTNYVTIGVFVFLVLAFFFLSLSKFIETSSMANAVRLNKVGGACTFLCGLGAFYMGASGLMVPETRFVRLPLGMIAPPAVSPAV